MQNLHMIFLKYFFFLGFSLLALSSCEDVIELELGTTEPQLVIEATLDASNQIATVSLSKSNDFYDNSAPDKISSATITLSNGTGDIFNLTETNTGIYSAENVAANPDEVFTISIEVNGVIYEAKAIVPHPVDLNEIEKIEGFNTPFGGDNEAGDSIQVAAVWDDPAGQENFYRIRTFADEAFQSNIYTVLTDDFIGDGAEATVLIRDQFKVNTIITLELLSTDENYYDYFFQLSSLVGEGGNSTTPYNPVGNFDEEALGYFGIFYSSTLSIEL